MEIQPTMTVVLATTSEPVMRRDNASLIAIGMERNLHALSTVRYFSLMVDQFILSPLLQRETFYFSMIFSSTIYSYIRRAIVLPQVT